MNEKVENQLTVWLTLA